MNLPQNQDVLIIGGGIIGLSIARELRRKGVSKITIIEKNPACGLEASSAAAGMLAPQAETDRADLFYQFCAESRDLYPQFAKELFEESGIDIELDCTGTLYLAFNEKDAEELKKRYAWQNSANLSVEKLSAKEVLELESSVSPNILFGLRFPLDWQVENRKVVEALAKNEEFLRAEVKSLIFENNRVVGAETDQGNVFASKIVIASGAWTSFIKDKYNLLASINVKPIRGQMIAFSDNSKPFRHVIYTPRGYLVPRKDCRILVGATVENAGFENITTEEGAAQLLKTASEISTIFEASNFKETWAGLRPVVADGLPVLGGFPEIENLFIATAHYHNGILLAPKTGKLLADKITGDSESKYLESFSPRRFAAAKTF